MDSIRTSIDLPRDLHRRLHEAATSPAASQPGSADRALQGKAIRSVVVRSITLHHYE
jgi:hypothetical protein